MSAEGSGRSDCQIILFHPYEDWRKANVTSVFKKGKKEDVGKYRPVSLTSIPGKVMKRLVLDAISKQLEEKKVIRSSQRGFTRGGHAQPTW